MLGRKPDKIVKSEGLPTLQEIVGRLVESDVMERHGDTYRVIPGEEHCAWFEFLLERHENESTYPDLPILRQQLDEIGILLVVRAATDEELQYGAAETN